MSSTLVLKGEWFLASDKEKRLSGILTLDENNDGELELFGSFSDDILGMDFRTNEIILGLTCDSELVTLYGASTQKIGSRKLVAGQEIGPAITTYIFRYLLIGAHIEKKEDFKFDRISCEMYNLDEWVGLNGFDINLTPEEFAKKDFSFKYKLPAPIDFSVDESCKGSFNFVFHYPSVSRCQKNLYCHQTIQLIFDFEKEKGLGEMLPYVYRFQNFLILAMYESTTASSFVVSGKRHVKDMGDETQKETQIQLYFFQGDVKKRERVRHDFQMIFNYRSIRDEFPFVIREYYKKYDLLEPCLNLFFYQFYNTKSITENTFLNLTQAAETFHARIFNEPRLTLKARLSQLVDKYSNEVVFNLVGEKESFVTKVTDSRNYYTHYSKEKEKGAAKSAALSTLSEKIKVLLLSAILTEIGFEKDKVEKMLKKARGWVFDNVKYSEYPE